METVERFFEKDGNVDMSLSVVAEIKVIEKEGDKEKEVVKKVEVVKAESPFGADGREITKAAYQAAARKAIKAKLDFNKKHVQDGIEVAKKRQVAVDKLATKFELSAEDKELIFGLAPQTEEKLPPGLNK